ncbi:SDR family NAD(P)-dependent oxidoreductase [Caldalkalibacillus salinus]|uniref:SDR family NAD(P)-dependent oxidoreductase n=1 Tax=Caldalkalibacillus salinus TaxID=2803787 RepID=UPI001921B7B3|nr:SDR family NAD(P)-dependent oxidoreductase [Caldalkalibacillus salinus]
MVDTKTFEDKVVIVTGGAGGIGLATVKQFAEQGAHVVIADINQTLGTTSKSALAAEGYSVSFQHTDVADEADCEALMSRTIEQFGHLDILVNNVGIEVTTPIHNMSIEEWNRVMNVNLTSVFLCSKHALQHMLRQKSGAIVNVSSVGGLVAWPKIAAYNASKGGVLMLTKAMASDYARDNIRVNCVCPSIIDSPMTDTSIGAENRDEIKAQKAKLNPIGRLGQPEDVASAILYLASDQASFVTGTALTVDGGYTAV